ncbi:OmpA family protein [Pseudanabaena sp. FACHB-1277]|uniref:OmpA family protein n=1 Tax=Pseudanabaena cinerea FACHB-1277 TaxID=2949581 RepID=A0A926Z9D9_9CYAN|nr:OmpA family protein [Pseudanabaena cinerea]MBD2151834.1 OmpA family protein [Pseudanabaena cinerea FACHB-1277]
MDEITDTNRERIIESHLQERKWQIPANQVAAEFGEVNVARNVVSGEQLVCDVQLTIAMEPQGQFAEGWRTGLALDGSASMKRAYGRKVEARVDPALLTDYIKQGRLRSYVEDGEPIRRIEREAFAEMQAQGYEINYTANLLQPLVQDFTAYLAGSVDGIGKTALIYWGCGKGDEIQVLGEFDAVGCQQLVIAGPATVTLGKSTKLLPAIAYFSEQYHQAKRGMFIFLTDGRIDDLAAVKNYTRQLALEIATGKRNYLKLILIGVGNDVDRYQLQELDDFDTGFDIDIWDYKIASEMTNLSQIFAEVVNENLVIAEGGKIYDDRGNCVKSYGHGLPAYIDFTMANDAQWFELEVNGQRIRQNIDMESAAIAPLAKKSLMDFELQAIASRDQALSSSTSSSISSSMVDNYQSTNAQPVLVTEQLEDNADHRLFKYWKLLAALLIGLALLGTAIAFGILMQRSDDASPDFGTDSNANPNTNLNADSNANSNANSNVNSNAGKRLDAPIAKTGNDISSNAKSITSKSTASKSTASKSTISKSTASKSTVPKSTDQKSPTPPIAAPIPTASTAKSNPNSSRISSTTSTAKPTSMPNDNNSIASVTLPITDPDVEAIIFFAADEAIVSETESLKIEQFWQKIQGKTGIISVSGHTDRTGEYAYNLDISKERANEVVRLLRDRGVDNNYKITFEALSWLQPKESNTNPSLNRRVVIQFKENSPKQ